MKFAQRPQRSQRCIASSLRSLRPLRESDRMPAFDREKTILPGTGRGTTEGGGGARAESRRIKGRKHLTSPPPCFAWSPSPGGGGASAPHPKAGLHPIDTPPSPESARDSRRRRAPRPAAGRRNEIATGRRRQGAA